MRFVKIEKTLTFNRLHLFNLWINIVSLLIIFLIGFKSIIQSHIQKNISFLPIIALINTF